jgi:hypothetical protein
MILSPFNTGGAQPNIAARLDFVQARINLAYVLMKSMAAISEPEFSRIVDGIRDDRELIVKHNPIGPEDEILLWMLLSCIVSYLSLEEQETPCFTGRPDADTYREAIRFVLRDRRDRPFNVDEYLDRLVSA